MRKVSVIIPVYKDWATLEACISSLMEYLNKEHKVIIVNDMSVEWESLETNIKSLIKNKENYYYYKNEENMGFIKTCNRAVFELDTSDNDILLLNSDTKVTEGFLEEMLAVLYQSEKHGVVCPRSNNATLLTVPIKNNYEDLLSPEKSYECYLKVKDFLSRATIIPTGVGFCMLIKRFLLNTYGLFDEIYGLGYNEENDFCMRLNQYGYSILMANHAYVYHFEGKSFGDRKKALDERNSQVLKKRYPYYDRIVDLYFNKDIDPVDNFADLIDNDLYEKKRILISLYGLPAAYNGTAEHGLAILNEFYNSYKDKYDISILVNQEADKFHGISGRYKNVYYPCNIKGTFHLAYVPSQIFHIEHLFILNRVSLKNVFCMQDIISLRSNYLLANDWEKLEIFKKSIKFCDGMTAISDFTIEDTKAYFEKEFSDRNIPIQKLYLATNKSYDVSDESKFERIFEQYFIVFGNNFKHKFIENIMPYLKKSKYNFVIIGSNIDGEIDKNIYGYKSGKLDGEFIDYLIYNSIAILFPSVYEGLGLPIFNGIDYNKKVIVNNNSLNRELKEYLRSFSENIMLFNDGKQLESILKQVFHSPVVVYKDNERIVRTWKDVATELESFLESISNKKTDVELLRKRWTEMRYLENIHRCYVPNSFCIDYSNISLKLAIKERIRNRFPRIYMILKTVKQIFQKRQVRE